VGWNHQRARKQCIRVGFEEVIEEFQNLFLAAGEDGQKYLVRPHPEAAERYLLKNGGKEESRPIIFPIMRE